MLFRHICHIGIQRYETNYMTEQGRRWGVAYMLAFLLAVVVLLSLMFRYVTGVCWFNFGYNSIVGSSSGQCQTRLE